MADSGWTTTTTGYAPSEAGYKISRANFAVQATLSGTGAVSATNSVQVSNDGEGWVEIADLDLSDTDVATDIITVQGGYKLVRIQVEAISGTGASCAFTVDQRKA